MVAFRRKPRVPKGYRDWPANRVNVPTRDIPALYAQGLAGCKYDPESRERMLSKQQYPDGEKAAYDFSLAGTGAGKLSLPYLAAYAQWPKMWPCPGQTTGDCVSHAGKNAAIVLIGVEVASGQLDPVTGKPETFPVVSDEGQAQGVVACENIYGYRGHSGQGASCERLIEYVTEVGGIMLRQPYPTLGLDFTRYNASIGIRWGGSNPPAAVNEEGKKHQIRAATDCANHEIVRDFCANGYPNWACSGLGWSSQRDENGYSRQQGGWSHSWITMGYDDRPKIIQKYGFPLALYNHDWFKWNSGPRDIFESADLVPPALKQRWIELGLVNPNTGNLLIPEGSMWIDARLLNRCDCTAMSNMNGWPRRTFNNLLI